MAHQTLRKERVSIEQQNKGGIIRREDIAELRARARIDEVVSQYVALKPAGMSALKGLCPFHDEKTPSFNVRIDTGLWHCFGCQEGGDVISFIQKIDGRDFVETVESLAERFGVELRYESGSTVSRTDSSQRGSRKRIIAANEAAAQYFSGQLMGEEAQTARDFLAGRGFDRQAAQQFHLGYAPRGWENLTQHLRGQGYLDQDLLAAGLVSKGQRGVYDRFRGRLIWPIRDVSGDVIGFGARKIYDDDEGPKYLNTPESPVYRKSQVLYGIDQAKRAISREKQVVVVEGYTDVMAMSLSGVHTAVATCGTAFGAEHAAVVSRLLGSGGGVGRLQLAAGNHLGGEVIFTFDGDEAGQKAALRAFNEDQKFFTNTYISITPEGLDPCDLWLQRGPGALQHQVTHEKKPLVEFVIQTMIQDFNIDTNEGRVQAARQVAPLIASITDAALRSAYVRDAAGWIGIDPRELYPMVRSGTRGGRAGAELSSHPPVQRPAAVSNDPRTRLEQQVIAAALQYPQHCANAGFEVLEREAFEHSITSSLWDGIYAAGGVQAAQGLHPGEWVSKVADNVPGAMAVYVQQLAVLSLPHDNPDTLDYFIRSLVANLEEFVLVRRIADLRRKMQQISQETSEFSDIFNELVSLENRRREIGQYR